MITYRQGNLLESEADALVNTVNTVGVMGKGIALMFKERFARNFGLYSDACKKKQIKIGKMFVTETGELESPRWIINFPTKQHWRAPSKLEWIEAGLADLRQVILDKGIGSVAIPPLGSGNGGLDWSEVRPLIDVALGDLSNVEVVVYEPTRQYQNVAKRSGVESLTPARALIAELVRRYWILGNECSLLEIQKLAWFLERTIERLGLPNDLKLQFGANRYGPFASRLNHLLNSLDGSYLHCDKRITDASPLDVIWFDDQRKDIVEAYLRTEGKEGLPALAATAALIDGFESPYGMELLASVDWLLSRERVLPDIASVREGLARWPVEGAGERKARLFDSRSIEIALTRLMESALYRGSVEVVPGQ